MWIMFLALRVLGRESKKRSSSKKGNKTPLICLWKILDLWKTQWDKSCDRATDAMGRTWAFMEETALVVNWVSCLHGVKSEEILVRGNSRHKSLKMAEAEFICKWYTYILLPTIMASNKKLLQKKIWHYPQQFKQHSCWMLTY